MYRLFTAGIAIVAIALFALGCGGSSDADENTEALTKPQFIKQAEEACAGIAEERKAAIAAWKEENPKATQNQLDDVFQEVIAPTVEEQAEALDALPAPAGDEAKIAQMVENLQIAGEKVSEEGTGGTGAPEFFEFQKQAGDYGLETCALIL